MLHPADSQPFAVTVGPHATVTDLLAAESSLGVSWPVDCICDLQTKELVSGTFRLAGQKLDLLSSLIEQPSVGPQVPFPEVDEVMHEPTQAVSVASTVVDDAPTPDEVGSQVHLSARERDLFPRLTRDQLLALLPPTVIGPILAFGLRRQVVPGHLRKLVLDNQCNAWGDDELLWHMANCQQQLNPSDICVLDPLLAFGFSTDACGERLTAWFSQVVTATKAITVFFSRGHWTPVIWCKTACLGLGS